MSKNADYTKRDQQHCLESMRHFPGCDRSFAIQGLYPHHAFCQVCNLMYERDKQALL